MPDNIDTRVSPAIDGELIRLMDGYDEETAQFVGPVANLFDSARQSLSKLNDARELWQSNPAVTKGGAVVIVAKEAQALQMKVLKHYDLATRDLEANIAHTEAHLMEPLTEKAGLGTLNGEVRNFVRALDRSEREAFMSEALASDDEPTLTALLGAQPFLSGLTSLDRDHYLRLYHTKKRPDLVRRLDVMRRAQERLHDRRPILFAQFARAVGASPAEASSYLRADEAAKAALNIEPTA